MAKLPTTRRLRREDYPDADAWGVRLLAQLNLFIENTFNALARNLSFQENIQSTIREFKMRTSSTYTSGDFTLLKLPHSIPGKVLGVLALQVLKKADPHDPITSAITVDWVQQGDQVLVYYITGLENSTIYNVRLLII